MKVSTLLFEARHAWRRLARAPGFVFATVLMLSLGTGLWLFMRENALQLGGALLFGLALAAGFAQVLASDFVGVSGFDPLTYAAVIAVLVLLVIAASFLPTRRALRIRPQESLRSE